MLSLVWLVLLVSPTLSLDWWAMLNLLTAHQEELSTSTHSTVYLDTGRLATSEGATVVEAVTRVVEVEVEPGEVDRARRGEVEDIVRFMYRNTEGPARPRTIIQTGTLTTGKPRVTTNVVSTGTIKVR